jgi:hypothetical protein
MDDPSDKKNSARSATIERQTNKRSPQDCIASTFEQASRLRHERIVNFFRWKHQAEGMLERFWRRGDLRALAAFVVHVIAMRRRLLDRGVDVIERRST